ncbi:Neurotrophin-3 [Pteropus alecto]|uniref:Neurotrophin-3 n=1 Tax=Pteropus alecto TaxID=9402 RepID=L5KFD4_PTEAL|nr:Neurotrophin-3 [Pteropus alecto]
MVIKRRIPPGRCRESQGTGVDGSHLENLFPVPDSENLGFALILQVNKVMSILFYVIFLAYLRGIQGNNMDQRSLPEDSLNSLIIKLIQADILKNKLSKQMVDVKENYQRTLPKAEAPQEPEQGEPAKSEFQPMIATDTELLRQQRRYNSPRVLLSDSTPLEPPPLYLMEDYVGNPVVANRTSRRKRYAEHKSHRGEYSVCDSESLWVTDKSSAIDIRGHQVTVLGEIKTGNSPVKQYFYETRCFHCRQPIPPTASPLWKLDNVLGDDRGEGNVYAEAQGICIFRPESLHGEHLVLPFLALTTLGIGEAGLLAILAEAPV